MKIKYLILLTFLLGACQKREAEDCGSYKTVYGEIILRKQVPVVLYVHSSVDNDYLRQTESAIMEINRVAGKTLLVALRGDYGISRNDINTLSFDSNGTISASSLAVTNRYVQGDKIVEADIIFNTKNHNFSPSGHSYSTVLIHELLHFLGFKHVDNPESIMYPSLSSGDKKELDLETINNLRCAYGS